MGYKETVMNRQEAKKHLCSLCSGTRQSGSYFSNECKDDALKCQRITDFIRGCEAQAEITGPIAEKAGIQKVVEDMTTSLENAPHNKTMATMWKCIQKWQAFLEVEK